MTDWDFKIHAYLHDPPDKPFALTRGGGHEEWARELAELLTQRKPEPGWWTWIRDADHLASGADRSGLLPRVGVSLADLRHPLSGQPIDLGRFGVLPPEQSARVPEAVREEIRRIAESYGEARQRFFALWGAVVPALCARSGEDELGSLWAWLPADTRMPNHPVHVHQGLTSALATVLATGQEPALVLLSVGPVQGFIAQARRTGDLFAGSRLLSESILEGIGVIALELGPDHVLFPNLRASAAFWKWARRHVFNEQQDGRDGPLARVPADDRFAALPNRFLAVVPSGSARELCQRAEAEVRAWWRTRVREAAAVLEAKPEFVGFAAMAEEQVDAFLNVTWAVSPWPAPEPGKLDEKVTQRAAWMRGGTLLEESATLISLADPKSPPSKTNPFKPSGGLLYASAFDSTRRLLDAAKRSRTVPARSEGGLKCSLCGERGVFPAAVPFADQRQAWRALVGGNGARVKLRRGEALCGVCFAKRTMAGQLAWVPSTSEIAATPFKLALARRLQSDEGQSLAPHVTALADALEQAGAATNVVLPVLAWAKQRGGALAKLWRIPGEYLLPSPRENPDLSGDEQPAWLRHIENLAASLRREARRLGIAPPRPYLAVVAFDGDEMGKWLSGRFNRTLQDYLATRARTELREQGAQAWLDARWPVTPAFHATMSEACGVFSQDTALRTTRAGDACAFLVYAGGDDALALSSVGVSGDRELATGLALDLRLRFSGLVSREGDGDVPDETSNAGVVLSGGRLSLAFGDRASASVGIAVFHHRWPLGRALAAARAALDHDAKELWKRDALGIRILRRSGQETRAVMKFFGGKAAERSRSVVRSFHDLCRAFADDRLSPRAVAELARRLQAFEEPLPPQHFDTLVVPIVTLVIGNHLTPRLSAEDRSRVIGAVMDLATRGIVREGPGPDPQQETSATRLSAGDLVALVEAAAFLAREGDE